ncbi:uncharacterized protein N7506_004244 [Penicillium brevicompactum]|uniref:uncharacterized protein n=1 Tax=Penicillium brevicompactum TaxID=5074 RepID=UPI002541AA90|nr:uncharacterized protein N7506_004244 [Penicillium brevicompactum]KAJ5336222.1 hypothetical protein N7506_004244 [Penicillium brevicompactum]
MRQSRNAQSKPIQRLCSSGSHLLPNGLELDPKSEATVWYTTWLKSQTTKIPLQIFNIFHANHEHCTSQSHWGLFNRTFLCVAESAIQDNTITIDGMIGNLLGENILDSETLEENLNYARYFVFCILGYQTMLYSPFPLDLTSETPHQLCITENLGCCNYTHASLTQDVANCAREPLSELLMGFGVLLPSRNLCLDDDQSIHHAFQQQTEVDAKRFNAYALHYIAGIKVKWTDALSCHLEFNSATKEISLFRFPSFCQFSLAKGRVEVCYTLVQRQAVSDVNGQQRRK